jgi:hypothetical protein
MGLLLEPDAVRKCLPLFRWYFGRRAGLSKEDLLRVMPQLRERLRKERMPHLEMVAAGNGAKLRKKPDRLRLVAIQLLNSVAIAARRE